MAKKTANPETSRLTRKAGTAPRVARKPKLAETAIEEIAAPPSEPSLAPVEVAAAPPPPPAPPPPAAERYTFRPVTARPSARAFVAAIVRRARQEIETRTAPVRATLRVRFPWLPRFLIG
jgi:hypothetical protein